MTNKYKRFFVKKSFLILVLLFLCTVTFAQKLSWRIANPRIMRETETGSNLEFDVQVKCSIPGTYLWAATVKFDFNNIAFNYTVNNWTVTKVGVFDGLNTKGGLKYTVNNTINGAPLRFNLVLTGDPNVVYKGGNAADFAEIPADWTTMVVIKARLASNVSNDALAGIDFFESGMDGPTDQQYITSTQHNYITPCEYDDRNLTNAYTGRIYSALYGWSSLGGSADNVQYNDWTTNYNTTVWDEASIDHYDNVVALANNLTIDNGSAIKPILHITANKWLTVSGTLTNTGTYENIVVASSGSLISNTPNVPATVVRYIKEYTDASHGWHFLSSPVATQAISIFHEPNTGSDFYSWDEPTNMWINRTASGGLLNESFEPSFAIGKGYLIANKVSGINTFTGMLNNADITISGLTNNGSSYYKGWHLLGDPFSSALKWNNGSWDLSGVDANCQIWNEANASYSIIEPNGIIPTMNGFMAHTSVNKGSLIIPLTARVHNSQEWYKKSQESNDRILLIARDPEGHTAQESLIRFNASATEGYDSEYDSYFIGGYAPMFYSVVGKDSYSLNTLPEMKEDLAIPFSFIKNSSDSFSIELAKNLPDAVVYLIDKKTDAIQNLSENPVYNFTASKGDKADRFILSFGTAFLDIYPANSSANFSLWYNQGYIHFSDLPEKILSISLCDMAGREIVSIGKPGTDKVSVGKKLALGYYIVRIRTTDKVVIKKLFIN